jgi:imidazolonepropionase-like amidohydrolase
MKFLNIILFMCLAWSLTAQPAPAPPQKGKIAILGATAHLGNGKVIANSLITFENGKLLVVADMTGIRIDQNSFAKIINANGKHVYPGFIAANTALGLNEISAVRATRDDREIGNLNPHIRAIVAYNTDSKVTPTIRSNGMLMAQIVPGGGRIDGQSSVVQLDAWNWEDAAYKMDDGIYLSYPSMVSWSWRTRSVSKNKKYAEQLQEVEDYFIEAHAYSKNKKLSSKNLKFEAMRGLFDGSKNLYVKTNAAKSIMEAVLLFKKFNITPVIVGGVESWMVADFLKKNNVPVMLSKVHDLPGSEDTDIDQPFKTPRMLQEAGVLWCFQMDEVAQSRNLPFQAGHAVGFGLEKEAAIAGLTLNTAKILGIDKTAGSLEVGKDATLFISSGDALDMRTNQVEVAFIQGREIDLGTKQKDLYKKFKTKYENQK